MKAVSTDKQELLKQKINNFKESIKFDISTCILANCGSSQMSISSYLKKYDSILVPYPYELIKVLEESNISYITFVENNYPTELLKAQNPPAIIFYKGDNKLLKNIDNNVAIVGSRDIDNYSNRSLIDILTQAVATNQTHVYDHTQITNIFKKDFKIVSGLAKGVDTIAHACALDNNIPCIAVVGFGLDKDSFYPKENLNLSNSILENGGLIISAYPPKSRIYKSNFIARNDIVSALSPSLIVIKANLKSGTLNTAHRSLAIGQNVYTILNNKSQLQYSGNQKLIECGAIEIKSNTLTTSANL